MIMNYSGGKKGCGTKKMAKGGKASSCATPKKATKKMAKGGVTRGCGAATKGTKHSKKMG